MDIASKLQVNANKGSIFSGKKFLVFIQASTSYEKAALYLEIFFLIFQMMCLETLQIKNLIKIIFSFSLKAVTQNNFQRKTTCDFFII